MRKILAFWGWLALTLPLLAADPQCSAVFSNAVGVTTYNLTANSGAKLYNTEDNSNVINVGSLSGVSTICQGGAATCVVNSHAPLMTIPNAPIFGSLIGYTLNSGQNDTLSFNTTRSSFTINGTLNLNGNIYLNSKNLLGTAQSFSLNNGGVLNINGNVTIYASTLTLNGTININSGSLTLIVDSFNYNSGAKINGNNTYDKVVILARNSIAINDSIPAILYSNGSATVNSQGVVYGALTAGSIMLNGTIHYIQSATTSAEIPGCTNNFSGSNLRAFTRAYQTSLNGGIKIIGNTILGQKNSNSTICPTNNTNNAEVTLRYWDIDSDSSTFSSSSSTLTLTSNSEIVKAYLYWQGILSAGNKAEAQSVKLKTPTQTSYVEITSQTSKFNWAEQNYSGYYYSYQGVADVTSYVKESGVYTVADLSTTQGTINQLGSFGAWAIVVVYRNNSETFKNITLFDGYDIVSSGNNKSYTLSGFLTPTKGTVKSSFLTFTGEGDVDITGDYIQLEALVLKISMG